MGKADAPRTKLSKAVKSQADENYAQELAEKVNFLFQQCRDENGDRYNFSDIERLTNGKLDQSWLWKLAHAQTSRPSLWSLKALTDFFGLDPSFWFNPLDEGLKSKVVVQQEVQFIALRSSELTPEARKVILNLIDSFNKVESFKQKGD